MISSTSKADAFSCLEQLVLVPDLEMPQDWVAYRTLAAVSGGCNVRSSAAVAWYYIDTLLDFGAFHGLESTIDKGKQKETESIHHLHLTLIDGATCSRQVTDIRGGIAHEHFQEQKEQLINWFKLKELLREKKDAMA
ncbi:hypothetical protein JOM56_004700 [Amanita muscaria]